MTNAEKKKTLQKYCAERDCFDCVLYRTWTNETYKQCIFFPSATEDELNRGLELIEVEAAEAVDHPSHYQGKHECIDEMVALFGVEAVKHFCMCNVHKYRYRAANKNGQEDLDKADWYMSKLMELEGMNE